MTNGHRGRAHVCAILNISHAVAAAGAGDLFK